MKLSQLILIPTLLAPVLAGAISTSSVPTCTTVVNEFLIKESFEGGFSPYTSVKIDESRFEKVTCGYLDKTTGLIWTEKTYSCSQDFAQITSLEIDSLSCEARLPSAQELVTIMDWSNNPINRLGSPEPEGGITVSSTVVDDKTIGFQTYSGKRFNLSNNDTVGRYARFVVNSAN